VITESSPPGLEEVWPEVSRRLEQCLRARGASPALAEDVVQETALRVLQARVTFRSADDLMRWARVVAGRLVIDAHRRRRFVADVEVPDVPGHESVHGQVEGRLALDAVSHAIKAMTVDQRQALLEAQPADGLERRDAVRLNVRRHRARAHLRAAVDGLLGVLLGLGLRIRRWLDGLPDSVVQLTGVAVTAGVLILAAESPAPTTGQPVQATSIVAIESGAAGSSRPLASGQGGRDMSSRVRPTATSTTPPPAPPHVVAQVPLPLPGARAFVKEQPPGTRHLACAIVSARPTCVEWPSVVPSPSLP
jgi:hypothetical protein